MTCTHCPVVDSMAGARQKGGNENWFLRKVARRKTELGCAGLSWAVLGPGVPHCAVLSPFSRRVLGENTARTRREHGENMARTW